MVNPEEVSAWSVEELEAEIINLLPQGWELRSQRESSGHWSVWIQRPSEAGGPVLELDREGADKRLTLLDVFGWLWMRNMPTPSTDSPWVRRNNPSVQSVTRTVHAAVKGSHIPDPEDLDPSQVALIHKTRK